MLFRRESSPNVFVAMLVIAACLFLFLLKAFSKDRRTVVIIPRELMRQGYYYKGDCETVGTLTHCKDFWFEIEGYKPEGRK